MSAITSAARISTRIGHAVRRPGRLAQAAAALKRGVVPAVAACLALGALLGSSAAAHAADAPGAALPVVAAENFYGDVVKQIGGAYVNVTSILSNPDQDPHLFEASPKTARALQHARLVVYNGADYDPWMTKLLAAASSSSSSQRAIVVAADLVGKKAGDNPHLWYDPRTMPAVARAVSAALGAADPAHKSVYDANLAAFLSSLKPIDDKVAALRAQYKGQPVTATEPVFGYMSDAIGLDMRNLRFQMATMNDTEASASDIAAFERDLRERRVRVLIYNSQATEALTRRMLGIAQQSKVPALSVTETQPAGVNFQQWMLGQLDALAKALAQK
ncbi:Manganese ABC transporter substrate-binding lipoprotein [Paraburkholderia caffeinitolerans]|uniref:Manganese ABC transporter substrate-binding lipoprotein n=1 Tax=Paraburkholderia caffeinitolerans TaxID=1723730 RepID=A0A6J5GDV8_9BURK|nr:MULTISPECIES: metal ABC transporter solute-binding protein [Paraburkholderia]CAB3796836.1 Manganese ABC transporter substrate-binding lipoprotein [Paraburkholderia caffeinitolerans]